MKKRLGMFLVTGLSVLLFAVGLAGCDDTSSNTGSGHEHIFAEYEYNQDATCTQDGTETATCIFCTATDTRIKEGSALGHDYSDEYTVDVQPTATETGVSSRHCTRCDSVTDERVLEALGLELGEIKYNNKKKAININDTIDASLFDVSCVDPYGGAAKITVSVLGQFEVGKTVSILIVAEAEGARTKSVTINNIKVYGNPTVHISDNERDYVNISDVIGKWNGKTELNNLLFGASGEDSFGEETQIHVTVDGTLEAGEIVTVVIHSVDANGNEEKKYINNIKVYGNPIINYDSNITFVRQEDEITSEYFKATAQDSFGQPLDVLVTKISGIQCAGNTISVAFSAIDSKGNRTVINIKEINVYGVPTINMPTKTDFKVQDIITAETLGVIAYDAFNAPLKVELSLIEGEQKAGTIIKYMAKATDIAGNVATLNIDTKIYGMPTLTYENNYIKDSETVDTTTLKINALDSFGQELEAQIVLKNGTFAGGNIVNYIITATDAAGNTNELNDVAVKVYSKEDIKFSYKDSMSYSIKISSHGEEFITSVTDSFGESCTTQLELAEGYSLKGGRKVSLYVVATDSAGNIQKSNLFTNVKVFDIPTLSIADDTKGLTITDIEDLETLFVVQDSFGENLIYTVETMDTIVAGQYIDVSISARDEANNDFLATHRVAVIEDNKTCVVSLFFGDKFLDTIIVNDANNYTLPIPAEYTSPKGWHDATGTAYTDSQGKGYLTLSTTTINCLYLHTNSTIYSVNDLKRMSLSGNYTLMSDLNLQGAEWTPIGTKNSPFKGTFNGNGHVIANYKITSQTQYAGLFGYISNSTIQNLRVVDFVINISYADKYTGWVIANFAGGISGFNNLGNIKNCYASGSITTISNEVSYRYHAHTYTGGLVGYNSGTIANCHTAGSIMATAHDESYAGGLIGYNIGSIKNCYASSTVTATAQDNGQIYTGHYPNPNVFAGGLVGWNGVENIDDKIKAIIINSYASGNVTATAYSSYSYDPYEHSSSYASASATAYAGGLVGCNNGELSTIKTSYATGDVSARAQAYAYSSTGSTYQAPKAYVGGLVGGDHFNLGKGTIVNCLRSNEQAIMWNVSSSSISSIGGRNYLGTSVSRSELQSESFLIDTLKWDSDNWIFNIDAYPTLRFE